ncbi:MAG: hypothetical protein L6Q92_13775 [Phycisphaerae bacterium]|nr:hypothetical protein [Phycisphaerae bacterium]
MRKLILAALLLTGAGLAGGCEDPKEKFGRTWYIDGAGNWGFGVGESVAGLEKAGYLGRVNSFHWSVTFNPALDQTLRFVARGGGARLGGVITDYLTRFPDAEANLIALSAGTGVGIWAIEDVKPPRKVKNYVMLGSSLSSRYDVTKALANMKGNVYVYYSASDPVLNGPVRTLGTIDGTFDDSAGLVGLRGKAVQTGRVVNVAWSPRFERYGWYGGHTDCTTEAMMQYVIARHIVSPEMLKQRHMGPRPGGTTKPSLSPTTASARSEAASADLSGNRFAG